MKMILVLLALMCHQEDYPDGTIVLHKSRDGHYYHVAIVLHHESQPYVYQASPPKVQRMPLEKYIRVYGKIYRSQGGIIFDKPYEPYSHEDVEAMKFFADTQLGRRYIIYGWGERKVNCTEFVALVLGETGKYKNRWPEPQKTRPIDFLHLRE